MLRALREMKPRVVILIVAAGALLANMGLGIAMGLGDSMEGDAYYYYQLADSLSEDSGYIIRDGFWPEDPSMRRMPGWPIVTSLAFRVLPFVPDAAVMRGLSLLLNAAVAVLLAILTLRLFRNGLAALVAGAVYTVHPSGLLAAQEGLSEPAFLILAVGGMLLLLHGLPAFLRDSTSRRSRQEWVLSLLGFLLLGASCLVRANFLLWLFFFGVPAGLIFLRRPSRPLFLVLAFGAILFVLLPFAWAARNYRICEHFPVFSALRGQTFYGGNNEVVVHDKTWWGYWVFPNQIPGETPMVELARTMSEYEVDVYYHDKGKAYVAAHKAEMPKLLLGKLTRAYVPIPWSRSVGSYAINGFRAVFIAIAIAGLVLAWRRTPFVFRTSLLAMVLTNIVTVLMFYGYSRFAFVAEAFFVPFIGMAVYAAIVRISAPPRDP
jgi:4-amino-4-deoxy-L-arabinose transferase-like glycosyltransferase